MSDDFSKAEKVMDALRVARRDAGMLFPSSVPTPSRRHAQHRKTVSMPPQVYFAVEEHAKACGTNLTAFVTELLLSVVTETELESGMARAEAYKRRKRAKR